MRTFLYGILTAMLASLCVWTLITAYVAKRCSKLAPLQHGVECMCNDPHL